ncbi:MAG TPA: DUF6069 family protein [Euzebyales bacterium]
MTAASSSSTVTSVPRSGMVAAAFAVSAALVAYLGARSVGVAMAIPSRPGSTVLEPLQLPLAIGFTVAVAVAATILAWILERFLSQAAATVFTVTALTVLGLSIMPLVTLGLAGSDIVALAVLHVAVGGAILLPLRRALVTG